MSPKCNLNTILFYICFTYLFHTAKLGYSEVLGTGENSLYPYKGIAMLRMANAFIYGMFQFLYMTTICDMHTA